MSMLSPFFKRKDDNLFYIKKLEKECLNKGDSIPIFFSYLETPSKRFSSLLFSSFSRIFWLRKKEAAESETMLSTFFKEQYNKYSYLKKLGGIFLKKGESILPSPCLFSLFSLQ